ncbi:MAG: hypothetical protein OER88_11105, partial [Planctomycetota bacterium]|nr:hypothetical protein [Planctomycetota bacterium]
PRSWVGIMTVDPSDRNNMWTGTNRIYRSLDARASNWVGVSGPLYFSLQVTALEVAPSDSTTVYAGFTGGGLYKTTNGLDGSVTWTAIRDNSNMTTNSIRRIRVHPDDPLTVYAVFSGFGAKRLWKTVDGGSSWAVITGDLADVPINDLLIDADNPGTLLAATDLGVYRSDDDGATWYGFSNGLPNAAGIEFTYDRDSGKLRLGTHGRSMWDWQPSASGPVPVPDGAQVAGDMLRVDRLAGGDLRVSWDAAGCTGDDYNLFWGDLADVASLTYGGAICGAGNSGRHDFVAPATTSGNAFFLLASEDTSGTEGAHGFDRVGGVAAERSTSGVGFCGVTAQQSMPSCP